jgi:DNA helicase HerA-like ATPase
MADSLRAEMQTSPLLRVQGTALDPGLLFGLGGERARVSVINLIGLPDLDAQRRFVGQLAMGLFTWIKNHPAPPDSPVRGLLVIDEAKDFLPSGKAVPSREPLLRLAAQARKYGLGLVIATQAPKSIDHQVIANCTTHLYGRANSPAAIEVIQEQLRQRGGGGTDVPRLPPGRFYVYSEGYQAPVKISVPLCLSHHAATPLDADAVLARAARSRAKCG